MGARVRQRAAQRRLGGSQEHRRVLHHVGRADKLGEALAHDQHVAHVSTFFKPAPRSRGLAQQVAQVVPNVDGTFHGDNGYVRTREPVIRAHGEAPLDSI